MIQLLTTLTNFINNPTTIAIFNHTSVIVYTELHSYFNDTRSRDTDNGDDLGNDFHP